MSQPSERVPKRPRRRWYQYSLRSLLGLMTLAVALAMAWRAYHSPTPVRKEPAYADGCGHLRLRFVVTGKLPAPNPMPITIDVAYASTCGVKDESIAVGPGQGLANVIVWLRDKPPFIPREFQASEKAEVTLKAEKCRLEPHVCLLRTSQLLTLSNTDPITHAIRCDSLTQWFSFAIAPESSTGTSLSRPERLPLPVGCSIHPWMRGWLVVRDDPYMAVSASDGTLEIPNLPAGHWEFQAWHERSGYLTVNEWKRGRFQSAIEVGETTDLGTIEVPAEVLAAP